MHSAVTRPLLTLASCLVLALQLGVVTPALAELPGTGKGGLQGQAGAPVRPQDGPGGDARAQRSGDGGSTQPVEQICAGVAEPGAHALPDGPPSVPCSGLVTSVVSPDGVPGISIQKGSSTIEITGPGPVNYQYFIANTGGTQLTGIEVIDDHVDAPPLCPLENLPPLGDMVCAATYTVTQMDIDAGGSPIAGSGNLRNIATVLTAEGVNESAALFIPYSVSGPDPLTLSPTSPDLGTAVQGRFRAISFSANGGVAPYEFSGSGAPPGMAFQGTTSGLTLSGAPQVPGDYNIGVAVADSDQPPSIVERSYSLTVVEALVLLPPGQPLPGAVVNQPYEFFFSISGGSAPYGFSAAGVPPGMNVSLVGGQLRLSGSGTQTGVFTIDLAVSDSSSPAQQASETYTLEVSPDLRLVPAGMMLPDAVAGQGYEFLFTIAGGEPPFEFSASGVPDGLDLVLADRTLTLGGAGTQTGAFDIEIELSDSSSPVQSTAEAYSLRVVPELRLLPEDPVLPSAEAGQGYEFSFIVEGGLAPVLISAEGAPPGMQLDVLDGQVLLNGTPSAIGDYPITVSAQDSASPQQAIVREYLLSVVLSLEIDPETLPGAVTGQDYLAVLSVRNGFPPYAFELSGLPAGLDLTSNAISGRPGQAGEYPLTAYATDARGNMGSRDYLLEVSSSGVSSIGGRVPDAYLNTPYGYQLPAPGLASPVTWSGGSGLPAGLELLSTGLVNGVAAETGSFSFGATAGPAGGAALTGTFEIDVLPETLISAEPVFPPGLAGVPYRAPTAVRGGQLPYDCAIIAGAPPPGLSLAGCNDGIAGVPTEAGSFPFSLGVMDSSAPQLADALDVAIQVSDGTPIADPLPPDLAYQPPYRVPVQELAATSPGPAFPDESLQGLAVDAWGNRYLVGYGYNGSDYDIRVLKFSPKGVLLWDQVYDSGSHDYGHGIAVAESEQAVYASGYALVGTRYEAVLIRYDLAGVEQWVVGSDGTSQAEALYGLVADASGVYGVGERYNGNNFDGLVVHYSHAGDLAWQTIRSTAATRTAYAAALDTCNDAPCLLIGGAEGAGGTSGWIEQIDASSGAASSFAVLAAPVLALQVSADGLFAAGSTAGNDWLISALGPDGQVNWSVTESAGHRLRGLAIDRNGYLFAAGSGSSGSDALVALISPSGEIVGLSPYDDGVTEAFHAIAVGPEGLVTAAGQSTGADGNRFLLLNFDTGKAH